jgi:mycothiol synthase
MTLARDNYTMVHADLPRVVPSPPPEGVRIRTYRPGEDDQRWWEAWTEAFGDHWGQMSMTLAYWSWYTRRPTFNPEISLVAATGPKLQEIVGFCHCRIDGRPGAPTGRKSGLLRWVGVRRAWRRKGLGDALTRAGLIALREAGAERVYLGVDHGSWTGADRLYLRNGFTVAQRNLYYRRKMSLAEMAEAGG